MRQAVRALANGNSGYIIQLLMKQWIYYIAAKQTCQVEKGGFILRTVPAFVSETFSVNVRGNVLNPYHSCIRTNRYHVPTLKIKKSDFKFSTERRDAPV